MKQMTCAQMGGPADCNFMISGNTPDEMVKKGTIHVKQAHPDMARDMEKMSKADGNKWMADFRKKFDAAPGM